MVSAREHIVIKQGQKHVQRACVAIKYYQHTGSNHTLPACTAKTDTLTSTATTRHCEGMEQEILPTRQNRNNTNILQP